MPEFLLNFNYESEYGTPPATATGAVNNWPYFIVPASMLPTITSDEATFLGWSYNGEIVSAGDTITLGDGTPTFVAVWQKPTTYVIVDKDDLVAMADSVREAMGSEEKFDVGELKDNIINVINNNGLTPAMLTMKDIDERCTLCYQTVTGDKVVVKAPAFNSIYEIGVPSIIALFDGYGGVQGDGDCVKLYGSANEAAFYATGDCEMFFYGK